MSALVRSLDEPTTPHPGNISGGGRGVSRHFFNGRDDSRKEARKDVRPDARPSAAAVSAAEGAETGEVGGGLVVELPAARGGATDREGLRSNLTHALDEAAAAGILDRSSSI